MPIATASQTVGPYWHLMEDPSWADLTRFGAQGEKITLTGAVLDGDGKPCADACVEIWQSDPPASDSFPGFGRSNTDSAGNYPVRHSEARAGGGTRQCTAGAAYRAVHPVARPDAWAGDAGVFPGREAERDRSAADVDRGSGAAQHADRAAGGCGDVADGCSAAREARRCPDIETVFLDI